MQIQPVSVRSSSTARHLTLALLDSGLPRIDDLYRTILDSIHDGVYFVDANRTIVYWNSAAEAISGYAAAEVVGRRCNDCILRHCTAEGSLLCGAGCPLERTLADGVSQEAEVWLHHKKGHRIPVTVRTTAMRDPAGSIIGCVEVFSDNSRKIVSLEQARELNRLAFVDELTDIGNRRSVEIRLRDLFSDPHGMGMPVGVLFIDVDHFKAFNDRHGHDTGDAVLRAVAATLGANLRSFDTVGRWGGEEFIVVTTATSLRDLQQLAERLRSLVERTELDRDAKRLSVTVSIGGAITKVGDDPASLVARADDHLYQSKATGRNRSTVR
ncbi:MAG: diguanylate cyclase [Thermoanaerobaculia bacterium]|jgi:diguanylate cyclase (GGDEF)-like protein/PAS domain S-box-containing protein